MRRWIGYHFPSAFKVQCEGLRSKSQIPKLLWPRSAPHSTCSSGPVLVHSCWLDLSQILDLVHIWVSSALLGSHLAWPFIQREKPESRGLWIYIFFTSFLEIQPSWNLEYGRNQCPLSFLGSLLMNSQWEWCLPPMGSTAKAKTSDANGGPRPWLARHWAPFLWFSQHTAAKNKMFQRCSLMLWSLSSPH